MYLLPNFIFLCFALAAGVFGAFQENPWYPAIFTAITVLRFYKVFIPGNGIDKRNIVFPIGEAACTWLAFGITKLFL